MDFSKMLEELLKGLERFSGVTCGERVEREKDGVVFFGYRLLHCNCIGGGGVEIGLLLRDGAIGGFYYKEGEQEHLTVFKEDLFLDSLEKVLEGLVEVLSTNTGIGCDEWITLVQEQVSTPLLQNRECVINEKTGNRVVKLDRVLVDFGFTELFSSLVLGYSEGLYVLALTEPKCYWENGQKKTRYLVIYEATFEDAKDGNDAFLKVKNSCFLSKKGNKIYKLHKEDFFNWFHRVEGSSLLLE